MFLEGQLLYFTPFYFKNNNEPANKFFIILRNVDGNTVVASLPTSKANPSSLINISHGCINIADRMFNCYLFQAGRKVCKNGFCFELNTHVYGNQVDTYTFDELTKGNTIKEGIHYIVKGELDTVELNSLQDCLIKSNNIKNRIRRLLS